MNSTAHNAPILPNIASPADVRTLSREQLGQLAEELRINRNTVARAYTELESEGVVENRQGAGCFVKATGVSPLRKTVRSERLASEVDALIVQAHHLRLTDEELRDLLEERLELFRKRQGTNEEAHERSKGGMIQL